MKAFIKEEIVKKCLDLLIGVFSSYGLELERFSQSSRPCSTAEVYGNQVGGASGIHRKGFGGWAQAPWATAWWLSAVLIRERQHDNNQAVCLLSEVIPLYSVDEATYVWRKRGTHPGSYCYSVTKITLT
jgi:hypothetical protein